jgi:hypothetical protein
MALQSPHCALRPANEILVTIMEALEKANMAGLETDSKIQPCAVLLVEQDSLATSLKGILRSCYIMTMIFSIEGSFLYLCYGFKDQIDNLPRRSFPQPPQKLLVQLSKSCPLFTR